MIIPDKLIIIKKISDKGKFGEVFLCRNTYLANRKEAVKFIPAKGRAELTRVRELYKNLFESSVLEYLRKSKYIVEIYDAEILKDGFRINMEYLEKGSVQDLLNKKDILDIKQILKISECVLHALEYAHNKNIFHLDIKPGNILIKNKNTYKLSDFGLASIRHKKGIASFKEIYTIHIPPERISGVKIEATEQSDIYMFGVTIYRLLNGDSYLADQYKVLKTKKEFYNLVISGKFPDRSNYLPRVHIKLKRIVNKCLNINLDKRYKSIREIRNDLSKIKIKYDWSPRNISEKFQHWECSIKGNPFLEFICSKDDQNFWTISTMKYGKAKKRRITKYCNRKLKEKDFLKKQSTIFNEYF